MSDNIYYVYYKTAPASPSPVGPQVSDGIVDMSVEAEMSHATEIEPSPEPLSKRRWERYKVNVPIRVIVSRAMKVSIFDGRGTSLSEGGMALFAGAELNPGDRVAVEFTPPFPTPSIRVDARICNRAGYHHGVEFLAADRRQRESVALLGLHLVSFATLV
jgi:hypothetical protein